MFPTQDHSKGHFIPLTEETLEGANREAPPSRPGSRSRGPQGCSSSTTEDTRCGPSLAQPWPHSPCFPVGVWAVSWVNRHRALLMSWEKSICPAWRLAQQEGSWPGNLALLVNDFLVHVKTAFSDTRQGTAASAKRQDI